MIDRYQPLLAVNYLSAAPLSEAMDFEAKAEWIIQLAIDKPDVTLALSDYVDTDTEPDYERLKGQFAEVLHPIQKFMVHGSELVDSLEREYFE